ncbi:hypothetical protein BDV93DRAFT_517470 [Ceratobasidium sp. AG-I]|nr:hypothetical protein BDV93DRAFT_517470 [Ceratobasidium sp. AG-I]
MSGRPHNISLLPRKSNASAKSKLLKGLNLSHPVDSLSFPESVVPNSNCEIKDYTPLGSYNWVESPIPIIIIPGKPRAYKVRSLPMRLSQDSGYTFVDQNAWRCRKSPLEPIFRAIQVTQKVVGNESFLLSQQNIDIVTDRKNLRQIMRLTKSMRSGAPLVESKNREFRIDAQLAPNNRTLILTRHESQSARLKLDPRQPNGYGSSFEAAVTEPYLPIQAVHSSKSVELLPCGYHRIARYDMADLRFLVRYEVDAMTTNSSLDDLAAELQGVAFETGHEARVTTFKQSTLHHVEHGHLVPQNLITELKTTSKGIKWGDVQPQLHLSQTPTLAAGYHTQGSFTKIESHSVDESVPLIAAHQRISDDLPYMVEVLKRMREICRQHNLVGQHVAFVWSGAGEIQVYRINRPTRIHDLDSELAKSL